MASVETREMDPYLALMRFDKHPEQAGLSAIKVFELCRYCDNTELRKGVRVVIKEYMRESYEIYKRNVFLKLHVYMHFEVYLWLWMNALKRYEFPVMRLVHIIMRVCPEEIEEDGSVPWPCKKLNDEQKVRICKVLGGHGVGIFINGVGSPADTKGGTESWSNRNHKVRGETEI